MAQPFDKHHLVLYTYFRSSCSCRVRTACNIKGIPVKFKYVNLVEGAQRDSYFLQNINPGGLVPALVIANGAGEPVVTITQSVAILEWLEEAYPSTTPLLPPVDEPLRRARVRELVNIIAADVQPPTNLRILKRVNALGVNSSEWCQEFMVYGLSAYERLLAETAGQYSVGDELTLADVVLAPAVENALRWGLKLDDFPRMKKVYENIKGLPEFEKADWKHQEDTPESLRS